MAKFSSLLFLALTVCACGNAPIKQATIPTYPCAKIDTASAIIFSDFAAEIKSEVVVDIRPRVSGYLSKIAVSEGAPVAQGQVLFVIDQAELEQQYNAAVASVDVARANVATAELEVRKMKPLVEKGIISPFELEAASSSLTAALANLDYAISQKNNAKINLGYATVTSPVKGVVGRIVARQGTLVSPSDPTPLTSVSGDGSVSAYFSIDEQSMLDIAAAVDGLSLSEKIAKLPSVNLLLSNKSIYPYPGKLELASGLVDMTTGSVQLKANFENKNTTL
ncbi:MAG: efflux RND transporter periplasmic adaptor subunit, partial [Mucinivorans sp.]